MILGLEIHSAIPSGAIGLRCPIIAIIESALPLLRFSSSLNPWV
jgi:hypothetical protein